MTRVWAICISLLFAVVNIVYSAPRGDMSAIVVAAPVAGGAVDLMWTALGSDNDRPGEKGATSVVVYDLYRREGRDFGREWPEDAVLVQRGIGQTVDEFGVPNPPYVRFTDAGTEAASLAHGTEYFYCVRARDTADNQTGPCSRAKSAVVDARGPVLAGYAAGSIRAGDAVDLSASRPVVVLRLHEFEDVEDAAFSAHWLVGDDELVGPAVLDRDEGLLRISTPREALDAGSVRFWVSGADNARGNAFGLEPDQVPGGNPVESRLEPALVSAETAGELRFTGEPGPAAQE